MNFIITSGRRLKNQTEADKGEPLYVVKFGDADPNNKRVLITTQIHGNEQIRTEAAIDIFQKLSSNTAEVDKILEKMTRTEITTMWILRFTMRFLSPPTGLRIRQQGRMRETFKSIRKKVSSTLESA